MAGSKIPVSDLQSVCYSNLTRVPTAIANATKQRVSSHDRFDDHGSNSILSYLNLIEAYTEQPQPIRVTHQGMALPVSLRNSITPPELELVASEELVEIIPLISMERTAFISVRPPSL